MKKKPEATPENGLPRLCYGIAYFQLPGMLFSDAERTLSVFTEKEDTAGAFFYAVACQQDGVQPTKEVALAFKTHRGAFLDGAKYYVLEYPVPPPVGNDLFKATLAPHFSAIVVRDKPAEAQYFVLGQSPFGGTTLRSVSRDGINANLGPGSVPDLSAFLERLSSKSSP